MIVSASSSTSISGWVTNCKTRKYTILVGVTSARASGCGTQEELTLKMGEPLLRGGLKLRARIHAVRYKRHPSRLVFADQEPLCSIGGGGNVQLDDLHQGCEGLMPLAVVILQGEHKSRVLQAPTCGHHLFVRQQACGKFQRHAVTRQTGSTTADEYCSRAFTKARAPSVISVISSKSGVAFRSPTGSTVVQRPNLSLARAKEQFEPINLFRAVQNGLASDKPRHGHQPHFPSIRGDSGTTAPLPVELRGTRNFTFPIIGSVPDELEAGTIEICGVLEIFLRWPRESAHPADRCTLIARPPAERGACHRLSAMARRGRKCEVRRRNDLQALGATASDRRRYVSIKVFTV